MPQHKKLHILILALTSSLILPAQDFTSFPIEDIIYDIYENRIDAGQYDNDFDAFYENLIQLQQNPININQATQQQLEQLFFLTDKQIDAILLYVYRNGPLHSVYELQLIRQLETYDIRNLLPFITIGSPEKKPFYWHDLLDFGKHELTMRFDARNIENYSQTDKTYTGDPFYANLKYKYAYKDRLQIGLHAEKDVGEQFVGPNNYTFDSYGGYLQIKDLWKFKTIVLGDYKANFGEGLVLNQYLSIGQAYNSLSIKNRNQGLQKYGGNDEFQFFRGIGATIHAGGFDITAFYSFKTIDGALNDGFLTSYSKTGYHRTQTEINHRRTSNQHAFGADLTYNHRAFSIGITFLENIMKHPLKPQNDYYFHGKMQSVGSVHYGWHNETLAFFGETALASNSHIGIATINGLKYHPVVDLGFVISHRYYSPYYDNMYANAQSYKSRINNEQTVYLATDINLVRPLKISFSADLWKDYQYLTLKLNLVKYQTYQTDFQARWKHRDNKHRIVLRANHTHFIGNFATRSQAEMNLCKTVENKTTPWTIGANITERAEYHFRKPDIVLQGGIGAFYVPTYDNRFYIYENDVLYAFGSNMVMGKGLRTFVNLRYQMSKHWKIYLKIGNMWSVEQKSRTDIHFLLRYTH